MTYEEKLEITINAIREAKQFSRKEYFTKLHLGTGNGLFHIALPMLHDLLLQLQDEEKIIHIKELPTGLKTPIDQVNDLTKGTKTFFLIDICPEFDEWYEKYLIKTKTSLKNLDYINMLRIYDVVLDINEQIQLTHKTTVHIHLIPSMIRFRALFPADTIGLRDEYCENRLGSLKHLKEQDVITDYSHGQDGWDTIVTVSFVLSKFDDFYKTIMAEYVKRNKVHDKSEQTEAGTELTLKDKEVWTDDFKWEGKGFVFGKYGRISFTSDDRKSILKTLTDKKGGWATISELKGNKNSGYVRSTIKQIEDRLPERAKGHISIVSTQDDDAKEKPNAGAYRIKIQL